MRNAVEVIRTYLQMYSPDALVLPGTEACGEVQTSRLSQCSVENYRSLYDTVGRQYHWLDRRQWLDEKLQHYLAQPGVSVWLMYQGADLAGYFELSRHPDDSVEIAYMGLFDGFIGRGLGKCLLIRAAQTAWHLGANRVWLHTCTLDHCAALPNYLKRGFQPFKQEKYIQKLEAPVDFAMVARNNQIAANLSGMQTQPGQSVR